LKKIINFWEVDDVKLPLHKNKSHAPQIQNRGCVMYSPCYLLSISCKYISSKERKTENNAMEIFAILEHCILHSRIVTVEAFPEPYNRTYINWLEVFKLLQVSILSMLRLCSYFSLLWRRHWLSRGFSFGKSLVLYTYLFISVNKSDYREMERASSSCSETRHLACGVRSRDNVLGLHI